MYGFVPFYHLIENLFMETNKILQSSLLDIVFDGRNKSYGAYELRSRYGNRLIRSIGITCLLILFVSFASFVGSKFDHGDKKVIEITDLELTLIDQTKDIPVEPPPPPPPPPPAEPPRIEMGRLASPTVVPDNEVNEDNEMRDIDDLQDVMIGTANVPGDKFDGVLAAPLDEVHTGVVTGPKEDPEDKIFLTTQIEAQYPGGAEAWRKYISREMNRYMDELQEEGKAGTCIVQFIVDREGVISEVEALTMKGTKLAELCVNAIRKGPKWIPAENNGKKVKAYRKQPVTFQLVNE